MQKFTRAAATVVATVALAAGGSTVATAAPAAASAASSSTTTTATARPELVDHSSFTIRKRGNTVAFKVIARYDDGTGQIVSVRKAKLQVAKGGRWRTFKNLRLNSKGKGTYSRTSSKKRKYRVLVPSTAAYRGAYSKIRL